MHKSYISLLFALFFLSRVICVAQGQPGAANLPATGPTPPSGSAVAADENPVLEKLDLSSAGRGETVIVMGRFPKKPVDITILLRKVVVAASETGEKAPEAIKGEGVIIREDGRSFSFVVPRKIALGRYDVLANFKQGGKTYESVPLPFGTDGILRIETKEPIRIDAVHPAVSYPKDDKFEFKIIGQGFGPLKGDNSLIIEGRGVVPACKQGNTDGNCANEEIFDDGREIRFSGLNLAAYQGVQNIRVRVGERYSERGIPVTLARVGRITPALIAGTALALLIGFVALLLWRQTRRTPSGDKHNLLTAIFLDKETNTYSLSKFQFYLWTAAALFGYVYLSSSRSLVQGDFSFADIPENLPGIILIAASTSALAVGITSARGSKGGGDERPSLSDFITTGGLIAAERLQFFLWTIVGVAAFVFLTLSIEPGRIENLPAVPERFLYLMGISSFGYLGGKLARKPGPVISQIEARVGSLTIQIHGSNLSADATFRIDEKDLHAILLDKKIHPEGKPEVVTKDEQPGFAKLLRLTIATPDEGWKTGEHHLTINNPDGQKAVLAFTPVTAQELESGSLDVRASSVIPS